MARFSSTWHRADGCSIESSRSRARPAKKSMWKQDKNDYQLHFTARLGWGEHECDCLLGTRKGEGVRVVGASSHLFIKHFTLVGENLNNASHCCGWRRHTAVCSIIWNKIVTKTFQSFERFSNEKHAPDLTQKHIFTRNKSRSPDQSDPDEIQIEWVKAGSARIVITQAQWAMLGDVCSTPDKKRAIKRESWLQATASRSFGMQITIWMSHASIATHVRAENPDTFTFIHLFSLASVI